MATFFLRAIEKGRYLVIKSGRKERGKMKEIKAKKEVEQEGEKEG